MFHVSFLKPYYPDESDPSQNKSQRVLIAVFAVLDHDMEVIITHQAIPRKGVPCTPFKEYLVKWKGLPNAEASWEHELSLWQYEDKVQDYWQDMTRASRE